MSGITYSNTTGADGDAAVVEVPAPEASGFRVIRHIVFSYDVDPSSPQPLTIESPAGTTIFEVDVTKAGPGPIDLGGSGVKGARGEAVTVTLTGVAGSIAKLNIVAD